MPPTGRWASAQDWSLRKDIIIKLYSEEDMTLKEVMQLMEEKYGFCATIKMYKARFTRWGIHKYCKRAGTGNPPAKEQAAAAAGSSAQEAGRSVRGASALDRRCFQAQRRLKTRARASSSSPPPSSASSELDTSRRKSLDDVASPLTLFTLLSRAPDDLRLPEECISIMQDYALGAMEQGLWQFEGGVLAPDPQLCQWNGLTTIALTLLHSGRVSGSGERTWSAFRILQACFDRYKALLQSQALSPWLFVSTFAFVLKTARPHPDLAACFLRYARALARIVHPPAHPYCRILDNLARLGPARMEGYALDLFESCLRAIAAALGGDVPTLAPAFAYVVDVCLSSGLLLPAAAREKMEYLVELTRGSPEEGKQHFMPSVQLGAMRACYLQGQHEEARRLLRQLHDGPSFPEWDVAAATMALVYEDEVDHAELLRVGHMWGGFLKKNQIRRPCALSPLTDIQVYMDRFGRTDFGRMVLADVQDGLEMMAEKVGGLTLDRPERGYSIPHSQFAAYDNSLANGMTPDMHGGMQQGAARTGMAA